MDKDPDEILNKIMSILGRSPLCQKLVHPQFTNFSAVLVFTYSCQHCMVINHFNKSALIACHDCCGCTLFAFEFSSSFLVEFLDCVLSCRLSNFLCNSMQFQIARHDCSCSFSRFRSQRN
ncbi:uncharacterized protein LOC141690292 isoform X2 [Apium graveolens]|uniref:uncharacterized protein LOC141690292 isoform X2 n=1 Tax=Apium graveolens TaxID=4045 RepID=UPI003D7BF673